MSQLTTEPVAASADPATTRHPWVRRLLLPLAGLVVVVSLVGAAVAVATGVSPDWLTALGPTGRLSVPIPMLVGLVVLAALATLRRRVVAAIASGLVALAAAACVVSGFFDGGYADTSLGGGQRVIQVALVGSLVALAGTAVVRLMDTVRAGD